jgi:hypothetical protein
MSNVKIRAALELAINSMVGLVPAVSITSSSASSATLFTSTSPHSLKDGVSVSISNHTGSAPSLNGTYTFVYKTSTTFNLKDSVTGALITSSVGGVNGTLKANLTAWRNVGFVPVQGIPYQQIDFMFAKPQNPTYGSTLIRKSGIMQVTLMYPNQQGSLPAMSRAELIEATFPRGSSFSNNGVVVNISNTAETVELGNVDNYNCVTVKIPYWADVFA